jgi:metal-sulfur cluster biosynthetic enzyme
MVDTITRITKITKEELIEVFKKCIDPELGIDIWTLGLIYNVDIKEKSVHILMTFTSPFCPYGPAMVEELKELLLEKKVGEVDIQITFEPPWQPSDELREMMGM